MLYWLATALLLRAGDHRSSRLAVRMQLQPLLQFQHSFLVMLGHQQHQGRQACRSAARTLASRCQRSARSRCRRRCRQRKRATLVHLLRLLQRQGLRFRLFGQDSARPVQAGLHHRSSCCKLSLGRRVVLSLRLPLRHRLQRELSRRCPAHLLPLLLSLPLPLQLHTAFMRTCPRQPLRLHLDRCRLPQQAIPRGTH